MGSQLDYVDALLRILACFALTGLLGAEREFARQPAGFRTHVLVGLGATLFTLGGFVTVGNADPTRVAAQIVSGIGFLGAGAIIRDVGRIKGLTTASSLWVTAAIGMACGFGQIDVAATVTGLAIAALVGLKYLERQLFPRLRGRTIILLVEDAQTVAETMRRVTDVLPDVRLRRIAPQQPGVHRLTLYAGVGHEIDVAAVAQDVMALPGVVGVDLRA